MSKTRKQYFIRLIGRIIIFIICLVMCIKPNNYNILNGMNFFKEFSILHILWLLWMSDILLQIIPIKNNVALGSQKLFKSCYQPSQKSSNFTSLKNYIKKTTKTAYIVFLIWTSLTICIGILHHYNIINNIWIFMISVFFYVCDLICVLIWCPFRLIMKNKCCTTCRIFNWDHLMMFSPLIFIKGFFSYSLVVSSTLAWLIWEVFVIKYPERFYEMTNISLKCSKCTDKLCTQYCQKQKKKLRKI